jgi:hypothetical protein
VSIETIIPVNNTKFSILPTPSILKIKNEIIPMLDNRPRRLLRKTVESVNRDARKTKNKNIGIIYKSFGSVYKIIISTKPHKVRMTMRVGIKFFLIFTSFLLLSFRTIHCKG